MLPKKETKYSYNAFQARDRRDKSEYDSAVYSSLHGTQGCHLVFFQFFNTKNAPKYQHFYLATHMEHDQSSYFCRGPDDFSWGPAPVGPTLVTWAVQNRLKNYAKIHGAYFLCTYTIQAAKGHDFRFVSSARHKTCSIGLNMHLEL